jgi:hypothetical protein
VSDLLPLFVSLEWKGRRGSVGRRGEIHGGTAGLKQRKGRGRGRKEKGPDRRGHPVSGTKKKKKEKQAGGLLREGKLGRWAAAG